MDISIIITLFSIILQGIIGYEIGDMTVNALNYTTTRGQALRDGLVILICVVFRYFLDKWLIGSKKKLGLSRIVLDIVAFVLGTIVLLLSLEMLASGSVPMTIVVMIMVLVFTVLYEKDIYLTEGTVELNESDPYEMDEMELSEEVSKKVGAEGKTGKKTLDKGKADDKNEEFDDDLGIELEIVSSSTGEKVVGDDSSAGLHNSESVEGAEKTVTVNGVVDKVVESDSEDDGEEDDEVEVNPADFSDLKVYTVELVKLLACVASVLVGILAFADVKLENYSPVYYLVIALVAALAVVLRAVSRGMESLSKEMDDKTRFIGFSVTVVAFTVYICFKSILVGLVFLLGAYLVKLIIPMAMNYWGTGGTRMVKINIDLLSRLVGRVFIVIMALLLVWFLSYGAIWEQDYLVILAIAFGMQETLMKQNLVKVEVEENLKEEVEKESEEGV